MNKVSELGEAGPEGGADLVFNEASSLMWSRSKKKKCVKFAKGHKSTIEQKIGGY